MARLVLILTLLFAAAPAWAAPLYGYQVVARYPHDKEAFTQGLFWRDGHLFESTGQVGRSSIRKVDLASGKVLKRIDTDPRQFGEGLVDWGDRLIQLTWQGQKGYLYDLKTFAPRGGFDYVGEGWGLTRDNRRIIMSDGTAELRFLDPRTLKETGRVTVTHNGKPVDQLNELEWIEGEVWANVWQTNFIVRIDPASGRIVGVIDLAGLLPEADRDGADVLNGIAYDPAKKRVFVTGKLWPALFEIRLVKKRD